MPRMFNLSKDIRPISYFKAHTAEMVKQVEEKRNPIVITQNGEAKAVLVDVESYQSLVDAIALMKVIAIGENDVKNGLPSRRKNSMYASKAFWNRGS
jgi:prevent-host-death family protein